MRKQTFIALSFLFFIQCAPATLQGLREKNAGQGEFNIPENYHIVYRKILNQARKCYQGGLITAQMVVQGDLFEDLKSGSITVAVHGALGVDTYMGIDIFDIDELNAKVIVYYAVGTWEDAPKIVKKWVLENYQKCNLPSEE